MRKDLKIAISGRSGCGNTTVSKMVADSLGLRFINFTFRSLAGERSLDLNEMLFLASNDDSIDREVDSRQVSLAREGGGCVLGSRLAIWMLEEADLKVYLYATAEVRAKRIISREGGDIYEVAAFTEQRDRQDHGRYLRIYNIDTDIYDFADLIIDTDNRTPREITDLIAEKAREKEIRK
ncbi:MAG: cytidylate kinase family protein [Treponema sp.]|nr:cytidylate kinase family protein [Treponema sp.]MCL2271421.1 cytidylate kinase family protein [Treponema sp.]